jgi:hypothetical protein
LRRGEGLAWVRMVQEDRSLLGPRHMPAVDFL